MNSGPDLRHLSTTPVDFAALLAQSHVRLETVKRAYERQARLMPCMTLAEHSQSC